VGVAAIVHLVIAFLTLGLWILVVIVVAIVTNLIIQNEIRTLKRDATKFKKTFPFRYFGQTFGDFLHVFYFERSLEAEIVSEIGRELVEKTPVDGLKETTITDVDKDLNSHEQRPFLIADAGRTQRGTRVTLLLRLTGFGNMQSVQWWVTAGGYLDADKHFNFVAYSPIFFWFWIIPYLRRDYDILSRIRTIYSSAYNDFDIVTQIRCLHEAVFNALVTELEKNNIDTSDLRVQRMQVMNISISGGRVNMGNVVQGAANKVAASVTGAAK
jgi:hypothetical protein